VPQTARGLRSHSASGPAAPDRETVGIVLETSRLRLEPLALRHADALCAVYAEAGVRRVLITCPETCRPELAFLLSERSWGRGLATEAFNDQVVGIPLE